MDAREIEFNKQLKPLTLQQRQSILDAIKPLDSSSKELSMMLTNYFKQVLDFDLKLVRLHPSAFEEYKKEIIYNIEKSKVAQGEPVGNNAAGSVSAHATQSNLSAYHATGIAQLIDHVQRLLDILSNKENMDPENMVIHFKDWNLTDFEVQRYINSMLSITVGSLLNPVNNFEIVENKSSKNISFDFYNDIFDNTDVYKNAYKKLYFKIHFNVYKLYVYNITLIDIAKFISSKVSHIHCVPSATSDGYIEVFIDPTEAIAFLSEKYKNSNNTKEDVITYYFNNVVMKAIHEISISKKRVYGMNRAFVMTEEVMVKINPRELITGRHNEHFNGLLKGKKFKTFDIFCDAIESRVAGIKNEKIKNLFKVCGIKVLKSEYTDTKVFYQVETPFEVESVISYINELINKATENYNKYRNESFKKKEYDIELNFEGADVYRASKYCFAVADTDNMRKVLSLDFVDPNISILHNHNKICKMYGIEAARNIIIRDSWDSIKASGNDISPAHIIVIADLMCSTGQVTAISSKGASKHGREVLADATFEKPIEFISRASLSGTVNQVRNTSSCVFVGNKCHLGTGATTAHVDEKHDFDTFTRSNDDRYYTPPKISTGIDDIEGFALGDIDFEFTKSSQNFDFGEEPDVYDEEEIDQAVFDELGEFY